jgi:hypothetical protein
VILQQVNLAEMSPLQLLGLHSSIGEELRRRELVRSSNNPVGDLAETLFCQAFNWRQAPNSMPSADAVCEAQIRYQIKARRLTASSGSRQLSAIRNLAQDGFDILAGVLFSADYSIHRAALIPVSVVRENSKHQSHTNSALFHLRDSVWEIDGVVDVTQQLRSFAMQWK